MGADALDGVAAADALAVDDGAKLSLDRVGDHGGGDGAEELALLADLGVNGDGLAIDGGLHGLRGGNTLGLALLDVATALLELLDVARGGGLGLLVGEQEVLREALSDLYDVALAALTPKLLKEDDFHGILLRRSACADP